MVFAILSSPKPILNEGGDTFLIKLVTFALFCKSEEGLQRWGCQRELPKWLTQRIHGENKVKAEDCRQESPQRGRTCGVWGELEERGLCCD